MSMYKCEGCGGPDSISHRQRSLNRGRELTLADATVAINVGKACSGLGPLLWLPQVPEQQLRESEGWRLGNLACGTPRSQREMEAEDGRCAPNASPWTNDAQAFGKA